MPRTNLSRVIASLEEALALTQEARRYAGPARERRRRTGQLLARLAARARDLATVEDLEALDELVEADHEELTMLLETLATLHAVLIAERQALRGTNTNAPDQTD